jgi:choline dehydrogenase-like flavoprotein
MKEKIADFHYDVIVIGTGAGGGTLVNRLASSGKKILVLERGTFLPREKANWNSKEVLQKQRYRTSEVWYGKDGKAMCPATHYYVGGNTKFYGGALFRFREQTLNKSFTKVASLPNGH